MRDGDGPQTVPIRPAVRPLPARLAAAGRCLVMGVVNVTPDSFSDGGFWLEPAAAIAHGKRLLDEGADILDIGGESTRPGAERIAQDDELSRVMPVVTALAAYGACCSIDTTRALVAKRAVEAGAQIVNDVSGGLADPEMPTTIASLGVAYIAMHWRAPSSVMDGYDRYTDVVAEVRDELAARMEALMAAGVGFEQIVLDPGLGFAKAGARNWPLLTHLSELAALGRPVLIGASRKRFLGHLLADGDDIVPPLQRDAATAAVTALVAAAGAWCVRVHDVRPSADAVRVAAAWDHAKSSMDN